VFSLDVRPALDSIGSAKERVLVATENTMRMLKDMQEERKQ
jgi:hypothetical protein